MWISKARYTELVKAETRAEWLTVQLNTASMELAHLRERVTGIPQTVPIIQREATPRPVSPDTDDFNDMGDAEALKHGAKWDENGVVYYDGK